MPPAAHVGLEFDSVDIENRVESLKFPEEIQSIKCFVLNIRVNEMMAI